VRARTGSRRPTTGVAIALVLAVLCAACEPVRHGSLPTATGGSSISTPAPVVQVVGLGDSVTAGTACGCQDFVRLYASGLARRWHRVVHESNLGRAGLTSAGLLARLGGDPAVRSRVAAADVVLVTIGANDLVPALQAWDDGSGHDEATCAGACDGKDLGRVGVRVQGALREIRQLRGDQPTLVLVTTYWNVFEDGDVAAAHRGAAYLRWSDGLSRRLNEAIEHAARAESAVSVDLYAPFKADGRRDPTPLLAGDGDHPNAAGHRLIASALLAATPTSPAGSTTS
jgi:lysophospholipase L1-like esterase